MRTVTATDPQDLARWIEQDAALVIDVREADEAAGNCLPGAHKMPLSQFALEDVPAELDKRVVFLCGEGVRSASAGQQVLDDGWLPQAYYLSGGVGGWTGAGLPLGGCA